MRFLAILETEVEVEFLQTLISIYLGPMRKGVDVWALQMKLRMANL
jgi:hypothetical protein